MQLRHVSKDSMLHASCLISDQIATHAVRPVHHTVSSRSGSIDDDNFHKPSTRAFSMHPSVLASRQTHVGTSADLASDGVDAYLRLCGPRG